MSILINIIGKGLRVKLYCLLCPQEYILKAYIIRERWKYAKSWKTWHFANPMSCETNRSDLEGGHLFILVFKWSGIKMSLSWPYRLCAESFFIRLVFVLVENVNQIFSQWQLRVEILLFQCMVILQVYV